MVGLHGYAAAVMVSLSVHFGALVLLFHAVHRDPEAMVVARGPGNEPDMIDIARSGKHLVYVVRRYFQGAGVESVGGLWGDQEQQIQPWTFPAEGFVFEDKSISLELMPDVPDALHLGVKFTRVAYERNVEGIQRIILRIVDMNGGFLPRSQVGQLTVDFGIRESGACFDRRPPIRVMQPEMPCSVSAHRETA